MSKRHLNVLLIEDSDDDAELIARALTHGGYALDLTRVDSEEQLRAALVAGGHDLALTDHELPGFDSTRCSAPWPSSRPACHAFSSPGRSARRPWAPRCAMAPSTTSPSTGSGACPERSSGASPGTTSAGSAPPPRRRSHAAGGSSRPSSPTPATRCSIVSDERRLVDANPAAAEMFGSPREQLVSSTPRIPDAQRLGCRRRSPLGRVRVRGRAPRRGRIPAVGRRARGHGVHGGGPLRGGTPHIRAARHPQAARGRGRGRAPQRPAEGDHQARRARPPRGERGPPDESAVALVARRSASAWPASSSFAPRSACSWSGAKWASSDFARGSGCPDGLPAS